MGPLRMPRQRGVTEKMMSGIEEAAAKLYKDVSTGATNLDELMSEQSMEAIGRSVLSSTSEADVAAFAKNLDKILPALQGMRG